MSHTWEHGKTRFIGNSDLSGDIQIATKTNIIVVPGEDLVSFVQARMDDEMIDDDKSADDHERAIALAKRVLRLENNVLDAAVLGAEFMSLARELLKVDRRADRLQKMTQELLRSMAIAGLTRLGMEPAEAERIVAQVEVRLD